MKAIMMSLLTGGLLTVATCVFGWVIPPIGAIATLSAPLMFVAYSIYAYFGGFGQKGFREQIKEEREKRLAELRRDTPVKSRITYIVLVVLLGFLGVHNFYLKRFGCAWVQALLTVITTGYLAPIVWIWAGIEAIVVKRDGVGRQLA